MLSQLRERLDTLAGRFVGYLDDLIDDHRRRSQAFDLRTGQFEWGERNRK